MYRIRRFGIVKTATTVAVMYMVIFAVFLIPFLLIVAAVGPSIDTGSTNMSLSVGNVAASGLFLIVFYGLAGWVFTAIACALYNLVAGWIGGIEIQLDAVAAPPPVPAWGPPTTPPAAPPPPDAPPVG